MQGQTNKAILKNELQRNLRKAMTDAELRLWRVLRGRQMAGYKFRRQHPFGDFILDFVCLDVKLVIEVDGGQHSEQMEDDAVRSNKLVGA
ncbi:MAG: endonuclease domain-containing protein, partial [Nitrospirota bacterium]|nr:endonuclease domain-containing protein [Nitrospirota bacterium]